MKNIPKIEAVMTGMPHTIGSDISIEVAYERMKEGNYRHLPVMDGGDLVGLLSDRDVHLAASFSGASELKVSDVMTQDPYHIDTDTLLDEVVEEMAEKKYGCAIVRQANGKIVGIFTATDGLRVLGEVLNKRYKR